MKKSPLEEKDCLRCAYGLAGRDAKPAVTRGLGFCDPNFLSTIRSPCATRLRYQGPTVTKILVEPEQLSISDTSYQYNSITNHYTFPNEI